MMQPVLWRRHFQPVLKAVGLKMRVYDFRHTSITQSLAAGEAVPVVAARHGHANPAMTLNVYAHALPGQQEAAAERVERIYFGTA